MAWPECRFRNDARLGRAGAPVIQQDAASQRFQCGIVGRAFDLRPVGFREFVFRFSDARLQRAIVGQEQQAFAVVVEPPGSAYPGQCNVIGQRGAAFLVGELAEHIERLVEGNEHYSSSVSSCE